jgi:hypothetical protein
MAGLTTILYRSRIRNRCIRKSKAFCPFGLCKAETPRVKNRQEEDIVCSLRELKAVNLGIF